MRARAMRPFWIHQVAEYLIGVALISQGLQDRHPLVPTLAGAAVILNTAIVRGPLGAFKWVGRSLHRWLDIAVMVVIAGAAVQPWATVGSAGRGTMLVVLLPLGFLWFYTDWAERAGRRQRRIANAGASGEQLGRTAGRLAGTGFNAARQAIRNRSK